MTGPRKPTACPKGQKQTRRLPDQVDNPGRIEQGDVSDDLLPEMFTRAASG